MCVVYMLASSSSSGPPRFPVSIPFPVNPGVETREPCVSVAKLSRTLDQFNREFVASLFDSPGSR